MYWFGGMVALIDMVSVPGLASGRLATSPTHATGVVGSGMVQLCACTRPGRAASTAAAARQAMAERGMQNILCVGAVTPRRSNRR